MEIVAHRGARRLALENTLDALRLAYEEGADGVEFDVQRSADGELLLFHDDDLEAMLGRHERVGDLSWRELRSLELRDRAGRHGRMPHLEEVLELLEDRGGLCNLELKVVGAEGPALADAVAGALAAATGAAARSASGLLTLAPALATAGAKASGLVLPSELEHEVAPASPAKCASTWWVSSFDRGALERFARAGTGVPVAPLVDTRGGDYEGLVGRAGGVLGALAATASRLGASFGAVHPADVHVDEALLTTYRHAGLRTHVWTVNTPRRWRALAGLGVDAVITDDPGGMRRWCERKARTG